MAFKEFRDFLEKQIKESGLSNRELGRRSGVHHSYISRILNDDDRDKPPSPEIIQKLAEHLPCEYMEMMIKAGYYKPNRDQELISESMPGSSSNNRINKKDKEILNEVLENNELKMLLHEARGMSKEDLKRITNIAKAFKDGKI